MESPAPTDAFPLLDLPREIRDQILGEVLFPGEKQPNDIGEQDHLGLAPTAVRQIFPYDTNDNRKPRFDIAIIRTCTQLQHEAEWILYGTSSWNLMYQDWSDPVKLSYEFFANLPRRLRRLVQRVERKCYSRPYTESITLHDWTMFMIILARECPSLQSLKLWGPGDAREGPAWVETCGREEEWVHAILQIKTLKYFDIPVIRRGVIYQYPAFSDDFLPWLRTSLVEASQESSTSKKSVSNSSKTSDAVPFPFLKLDRDIRERIYGHALLPPDKKIHPYIKSWYDLTTRNMIPLFLTSKQIYHEASHLFYTTAIFTSPIHKYNNPLLRFLAGKNLTRQGPAGLPSYIRPLIAHVSADPSILDDALFCPFLVFRMPDITLHLYISHPDNLNLEWDNTAPNSQTDFSFDYCGKPGMCRLARFQNVVVETPEGAPPIYAECLAWMTSGLREEFRYPSGNEQLRWVREGTDYAPREPAEELQRRIREWEDGADFEDEKPEDEGRDDRDDRDDNNSSEYSDDTEDDI